jgi:hypothetical protein
MPEGVGSRSVDHALGYEQLHGFPAPAVVVLALDGFAVACDTSHTVIAVAAELAWLIAVAAVAKRVAATATRAARGTWGRHLRRGDRDDAELPGVLSQPLHAAIVAWVRVQAVGACALVWKLCRSDG